MKNRESRLVDQRERYRRNPEAQIEANRIRRFGLRPGEYDEMRAAQNDLCAICGRPERSMLKGKVRRLAVDHDHKSSKVRGLLCADCNRALGLFQDDPDRLRMAAEYLEVNGNLAGGGTLVS